MRFRPGLVGILLLLVVSGAVVAAGTAGSRGVGSAASDLGDATSSSTNAPGGAATSSSTNASGTAATDAFDRADPALVVTIQLENDGDARWHVTYRYVVNGSNETQAFRSFASDVKSGERDVGVGRDTFVAFADAASKTTGREMQIQNANWTSSRVHNGTGELTYSFTWTNFGRVEADRVYVGDAFQSPDGTWFPRLYDGQRLVIRPPSELNIVGTPPDKGLNQRALVWNGYREFEPGYLSVVLERPEKPNETTTTTTDQEQDDLLSPFLLGVGFALLLVFVGVGSYFLARWQTRQGTGGGGGPPGAPEASDGGSPRDGGGGAATGSASTSDASGSPPAEPASGKTGAHAVAGSSGSSVENATAAGAGASAGAAAADAEPAPDDPNDADDADDEEEIDEALLSDEERVVRLLEGNGGRMKQANIVTETGWSNAKVSQLLSGMHEDDEVQKLRIGRENLIALPDENVADFGSDE